jgi:hypothetical protein
MKTNDEIKHGTIREINKYFRSIDESHLFPVSGNFNVTERAIRRLRRTQQYTGGLEYYLALDSEISLIVNTIL